MELRPRVSIGHLDQVSLQCFTALLPAESLFWRESLCLRMDGMLQGTQIGRA